MKRIHKISRVRTIGGRRKAFRNIFRKNRGLIGKGYRKVAGKKILKKMYYFLSMGYFVLFKYF